VAVVDPLDAKQLKEVLGILDLTCGTDDHPGKLFVRANVASVAAFVFRRGRAVHKNALVKLAPAAKFTLPKAFEVDCTDDELDTAITAALKTHELSSFKRSMNE